MDSCFFRESLDLYSSLLSSSWTQQAKFFDGGPLFSRETERETSFTIVTDTTTVTKKLPCFVSSGNLTVCRRKRGAEEKPYIIQFDDDIIDPSAVVAIETTPAVPFSRHLRNDQEPVESSFSDSTYNAFRTLAAYGSKNIITVGDCGGSVVNFSQFLSCLGLMGQEKTTLTATFTVTSTTTTGFVALTVGGCTPTGFPYSLCPSR